MRFTYACTSALILVFATGALADHVENIIPLYNAPVLIGLLNDPKAKNELKITKEQEKSVKATLQKFDKATSKDNDTIFKMKGSDKERFAQTRALGTKRANELLQMLGQVLNPNQVTRLKQISLQKLAMGLFSHPEIREALNLSGSQVDSLSATHQKLRDNIIIEVKAGRLSKQEGQKQWTALGNIIPEGVRAQLNAQQRQTLHSLLGEQYFGQ